MFILFIPPQPRPPSRGPSTLRWLDKTSAYALRASADRSAGKPSKGLPEVGDARWEMRRGKGKSAYALTSFVASARGGQVGGQSLLRPADFGGQAKQSRSECRNWRLLGERNAPCLFEGEGENPTPPRPKKHKKP